VNGLWLGFIGGGISGLATLSGSLPILFNKSKLGQILEKINMDFVTGLMLSAAAFSLIYPAFQSIESLKNNSQSYSNYFTLSLALVLGVQFIKLTRKFLDFALKDSSTEMKKALLFVTAMMVHNFPEGLASGATMTLATSQGQSLLGAIALQNLPEGFTTALSFLTLGLTPLGAFLGSASTGLVELIGGVLGAYLSFKIDGILPLLMSFAGGAMMSVVIEEIFEKMRADNFRFIFGPSFLSGMALIIIFNNLTF